MTGKPFPRRRKVPILTAIEEGGVKTRWQVWLSLGLLAVVGLGASPSAQQLLTGGTAVGTRQAANQPNLEATKHPAGDVGNGWNAALTGNMNKTFGITADFSGAYGSGASMHTYTFGPKLSGNPPVFRPFVHALFGGVRLVAGGFSTTGFGMMLSGGFDVRF